MYKLQRVVCQSGDNRSVNSLLNKTVNCLQMKKYITSIPLSSENGLRTPYERSRQATSWFEATQTIRECQLHQKYCY